MILILTELLKGKVLYIARDKLFLSKKHIKRLIIYSMERIIYVINNFCSHPFLVIGYVMKNELLENFNFIA